jgi:hypothetical protein
MTSRQRNVLIILGVILFSIILTFLISTFISIFRSDALIPWDFPEFGWFFDLYWMIGLPIFFSTFIGIWIFRVSENYFGTNASLLISVIVFIIASAILILTFTIIHVFWMVYF